MITVQSMTFGYGKRLLFEGLELRLEPGNIYGLLGLNGAGKTSLLKLVAGALRPAGGTIRVFGREPARREAATLADLVFVPEDPWLPALTPATWIERYAVFRPAFDHARFAALLEEFCLDRGKLLTKYSYGQRKKFALACLMFASLAFKTMHEGRSGTEWILLPASAFEKYLATLAAHLLLYPFVCVLAAVAASSLLVLLEAVAGGTGSAIWTPFQWNAHSLLAGYGEYAALSVILIAGSATFRKHAALKTLGVVTAYSLAMAGLLLGGFYIFAHGKFGPDIDVSFKNGEFIVRSLSGLTEKRIDDILGFTFKAIAKVLVPLFALLYGYFRVVEKEARDEVQ